jgi:hypothetical protein
MSMMRTWRCIDYLHLVWSSDIAILLLCCLKGSGDFGNEKIEGELCKIVLIWQLFKIFWTILMKYLLG